MTLVWGGSAAVGLAVRMRPRGRGLGTSWPHLQWPFLECTNVDFRMKTPGV